MKRFAAEDRSIFDSATGRKIRQVTTALCMNHHPFFLIPAYDASMRYLYFVSSRTGRPQVYAEDRQEHCIIALSDVQNLDEWSVHPFGAFSNTAKTSPAPAYPFGASPTHPFEAFSNPAEQPLGHSYGQAVYYIADGCAMRTDTTTGNTEILLRESSEYRFPGGTTAMSHDGRYWAVRMASRDGLSIFIYDHQTNQWTKEYTGEMVAHLQFCPDDSGLLFFAGPLTDRVWVLFRHSGEARRIYARNAAAKQWITHESWIPRTYELSLVDWPKGILAVNVHTGAQRRVADFNAWHAISNDAGTQMVADTNFPDRGLMLFNAQGEHNISSMLCMPHASCMGSHWANPFPYDNGPIQVNAPQHTHPHPRFSPDGKQVVFTSDVSGFAQVYEIDLE